MARMETTEVDEADPPACAFLGLVEDRRSHFTYPHPAHRCFVANRPVTTDLHRQLVYCLSKDFPSCNRYVAWQRSLDPDKGSRFRRARSDAPAEQAAAQGEHTTAPPAAEGIAPNVVYVFRTGDSLARIAATYGLTIDQIVATNQLDPNVPVADGSRLVIPIATAPTPTGKKAGSKAGR
jgi:LysM repeat protein